MSSGLLCCGFLFLSEFSGVNAVFRIKIIQLVGEIVCYFSGFLSKMIIYKQSQMSGNTKPSCGWWRKNLQKNLIKPAGMPEYLCDTHIPVF